MSVGGAADSTSGSEWIIGLVLRGAYTHLGTAMCRAFFRELGQETLDDFMSHINLRTG